MKKHILTGLMTLLPVALTVLIIRWLFNLFTDPFVDVVEQMINGYKSHFGLAITQHEKLIFFASRLIVLVLLLITLFILGFIANKFFFRFFLNIINTIFLKIPVVKTIYSVSKEMSQGFLQKDKKIFSKTVLLPFPFEKTKAIGLVSNDLPPVLQQHIEKEAASIFVPTSPHPISGFLVLVEKEQTKEIPMTTEEAIKFLISCGMVYPGEDKEKI